MSTGAGILIAIVARRNWLTHSGLLVVGLTFEVVGALGIALSELGSFLEYAAGHTVSVVGISWVCTWIILYPLILPSRPRIALFASLVAASMPPLAFLIVWMKSQQAQLPGGIQFVHVVLFMIPSYVCAAMAYIGARIIYRLGTEVVKERELGSYQLVSRIGMGGMGEIWQAKLAESGLLVETGLPFS
jgi:serine/threonine-protein kinase